MADDRNLALEAMEEVYAQDAALAREAKTAALDETPLEEMTPRQRLLAEAMRLPKMKAPLFMTDALENARRLVDHEDGKRAAARPTVLIVLGAGVDEVESWAEKARLRQEAHDRERLDAIEAAVAAGDTPGQAVAKLDGK